MKNAVLLSLLLSLASPMAWAEKSAKETKKEEPKKTEKAEKADKGAKESKEEKKTAPSDDQKALLAASKEKADKLTDKQRAKILDLINKGDAKALQQVEGIGEAKAAAIIAKRPFKNPEDVVTTEGIGEGIFDTIIAWAKGEKQAGEKKDEKDAKEEKKPDAKEKQPAATKPKPKTK